MKQRRMFWAVFIVAAILRIAGLGATTLWYDEAGSYWMAQLPFVRMLAATAGDVHPPAYFAVLWAWLRIAGAWPPWLARVPSLAFSLWALWLAWRIGAELRLDSSIVLAGVVLAAVLPFQVYYAQEARMYTMLQALFLLAVLMALQRRWRMLGLANLLLLYTHNYGPFYAMAAGMIGLVVLGRWIVQDMRHYLNNPETIYVGDPGRDVIFVQATEFVLANALALVAWLPWLAVVAGQAAAHFDANPYGYWIQPLTAGGFLYPFYMLWFTFTFPDQLQIHAAILVFGLLFLGIYKALRSRQPGPLVLVWLTLAVPLSVAAVSILWHPVLLFRALAGVSIPFYMLAAWSLGSGVGRIARQYGALIVIPVIAAGVGGQYTLIQSVKIDPRPELAFVERNWLPGDAVLHANPGTMMRWHTYRPDWARYMLPEAKIPTVGMLSRPTRRAMGIEEAAPDDLEWRRLWFVYSIAPTSSAYEVAAIEDVLARYKVLGQHTLSTDRETGETLAAIVLLAKP